VWRGACTRTFAWPVWDQGKGAKFAARSISLPMINGHFLNATSATFLSSDAGKVRTGSLRTDPMRAPALPA
jgi:hypothetical protein